MNPLKLSMLPYLSELLKVFMYYYRTGKILFASFINSIKIC